MRMHHHLPNLERIKRDYAKWLVCAMLGDLLAAKSVSKGWEGVIIHGLIRDSADIETMNLGVKALGTLPLKSVKKQGDS